LNKQWRIVSLQKRGKVHFNKRFLNKFTASSAFLFASVFWPGMADAQQWSMGFWTGMNGVPVSSLNWKGLTHIAHVAVVPNADGSLQDLDLGGASALISSAHANGVKVLLDLGNTDGSSWNGATSAGTLQTFVNNVMGVVNSDGYDGVDIDWEQSINQSQLSSLISAFRAALGSSKLLTADAGGDIDSFWASQASSLDRISAMTYDGVGTWNPYSWFNAALYSDSCDCVWSLDLMKRRMLAAGVPSEKLNLGIPFYGWISTGAGVNGPRQTYNGSPSLSQSNYNQLVSNYNLSNPQWDGIAQVPWVSISNGYITFDNEQSVTAKVNYIQQNNLGGWIIWALDQDYFPTQTTTHPLLTAIASAMGSQNPAPAPTPTPTPTPTPVPSSWLYIVSKNSGKCLDDAGYSTTPDTQFIQWDCHSGDNQKFLLSPVNGGYEITDKYSGMQLDVQGGPSFTQDGVPIIQWPYWGGTNEIWTLSSTSDGYYNLHPVSSGKCLDVTGASTNDGAQIVQWTCNSNDNQKWSLVPVQ
jgi:hypothetical protein